MTVYITPLSLFSSAPYRCGLQSHGHIYRILHNTAWLCQLPSLPDSQPRLPAKGIKCASLKGIVHFEIHFWYVSAYLKGIQDVGVFISTVLSILIFLGQTVFFYNAGLWSPPQRACAEKSKLNVSTH